MTSALGGLSSRNTMSHLSMSVGTRPNPAKMAEAAFSKLDTGGKGYIDKADFQSAIDQASSSQNGSPSTGGTPSADDMLKVLDASGDGKVTAQEFTDGMQKLAAKTGPPSGMQGPPPGGMQGGGAQGASSSSQTYDPADANKDGIVTTEELVAYRNTSAYLNSHPSSDTTNQDGTSNDPSVQAVQNVLRSYMQNSGLSGVAQSNSISVTA